MIDGLIFEPVEHAYFYKGARVPNVTTILNVIDETWRVDPEVLKAAADLGTAVHKACELSDLNDLDEDDLDPQIQPYLAAWKRFRAETGFVPELNESRVWHPQYRYAGTLDRVGVINGKRAVLDIKSGSKWPSHGPQTAAYAEAEKARTKTRIDARYCCYLTDQGKYRLIEKKDPADFSTFLACLSIRRFHETHRTGDNPNARIAMNLTIDMPNEAEMLTAAESKVTLVESFIVDSPLMFQEAGSELQAIVAKIDALEEQRVAITGPLLNSKRLIDALFKKPTERLQAARDTLKRAMLTYQREVDRRAQEAREAEAAAERKRREDLAAQAAAAQARADEEAAELRRRAEAATAAGRRSEAARLESKAESRTTDGAARAAELTMASQAVTYRTPTTVSAPKAAGITTRKVWKAECTDKAALIKHVAENPAFLHFLKVDETALRQFAISTRGAAPIPGVRIYEDQGLSVRAA